MSRSEQVAVVAQAIREREPISAPRFTLSEFRDLHNRLQGVNSTSPVGWCVVLLGDEALVQAAGSPEVTINLYDGRGRIYSEQDFDFLPHATRQIVGSVSGKYRFVEFLKEIGRTATFILFLSVVVITMLFIDAIPLPFISALNDALVGALSIFVSIFVLFVLSVNTDKEYRYLRGGRFHKLARSDSYIAAIGLAALTSSILGNALAAVAPTEGTFVRVCMALASALGVTLTAASFWLVITYHLVRKHEMAAYQMALRFLAEANPPDDH